MKKIFILIAVLAPVVVFGSCMRRATEKLGEKVAEKVVEKAVENAVKAEGGDVDIELPTVGGGIDLPDGFPEDSIPIYQKKDAVQIVAARTVDDGNVSYVLTFQVPDGPKEAYEFYRDVPGQTGQELIELGSMFTITSMIDGYEMNVAIMDISESGDGMKSGITMGVSAPTE